MRARRQSGNFDERQERIEPNQDKMERNQGAMRPEVFGVCIDASYLPVAQDEQARTQDAAHAEVVAEVAKLQDEQERKPDAAHAEVVAEIAKLEAAQDDHARKLQTAWGHQGQS